MKEFFKYAQSRLYSVATFLQPCLQLQKLLLTFLLVLRISTIFHAMYICFLQTVLFQTIFYTMCNRILQHIYVHNTSYTHKQKGIETLMLQKPEVAIITPSAQDQQRTQLFFNYRRFMGWCLVCLPSCGSDGGGMKSCTA